MCILQWRMNIFYFDNIVLLMAVPFIYLQDTESDEEDNFNLSQAAPPNAELERLDDSGSSETTDTTTESTKEKRLSAKEKKALKKKKYYLLQLGSYLIMEFKGKAYVVVAEPVPCD